MHESKFPYLSFLSTSSWISINYPKIIFTSTQGSFKRKTEDLPHNQRMEMVSSKRSETGIYESPTEMGLAPNPNGERERWRPPLISLRTGLISDFPGDQSMILLFDSCLILITWLWSGKPISTPKSSFPTIFCSIFYKSFNAIGVCL